MGEFVGVKGIQTIGFIIGMNSRVKSIPIFLGQLRDFLSGLIGRMGIKHVFRQLVTSCNFYDK